jgi:hypothetical protein
VDWIAGDQSRDRLPSHAERNAVCGSSFVDLEQEVRSLIRCPDVFGVTLSKFQSRASTRDLTQDGCTFFHSFWFRHERSLWPLGTDAWSVFFFSIMAPGWADQKRKEVRRAWFVKEGKWNRLYQKYSSCRPVELEMLVQSKGTDISPAIFPLPSFLPQR